MFGIFAVTPYFCTPSAKAKGGLPDSIMVVRQILVLFVLVRIQVGQLTGKVNSLSFFIAD